MAEQGDNEPLDPALIKPAVISPRPKEMLWRKIP